MHVLDVQHCDWLKMQKTGTPEKVKLILEHQNFKTKLSLLMKSESNYTSVFMLPLVGIAFKLPPPSPVRRTTATAALPLYTTSTTQHGLKKTEQCSLNQTLNKQTYAILI